VVVVLRGRPGTPRVVRQGFWDLVRSGVAPREAGLALGVRAGAERWFVAAGGVKGNGPGPVLGRYLSLAEREEVAVGLAAGKPVRQIAGAGAGGVDGVPGGGAERAAGAVPGGAGAGAGGAAGAAAEAR